MGRQINFHFDDFDEKVFLELPQFKNIVFLKFRELKLQQYEKIILKEFSRISDTQSQTILCLTHDLENVRLLGSTQNYFIDVHGSPVIEFSRSGFRPELNLLISGRLWYQHKYWAKDENGNDVIKEKSEELRKLYDSLARWIKKYCTRLPNGNYIGPHAMELHKNGAKLSP